MDTIELLIKILAPILIILEIRKTNLEVKVLGLELKAKIKDSQTGEDD